MAMWFSETGRMLSCTIQPFVHKRVLKEMFLKIDWKLKLSFFLSLIFFSNIITHPYTHLTFIEIATENGDP